MKELTPEQFHVIREKGTEPPGSGKYLHEKAKGMYTCASCGAHLFPSDYKFESGTGWPSFYDALPGTVEFRDDPGMGMRRTEIVCAKCGGHLGHIFDDGPKPTGKRYCVNSLSLDLKKA